MLRTNNLRQHATSQNSWSVLDTLHASCANMISVIWQNETAPKRFLSAENKFRQMELDVTYFAEGEDARDEKEEVVGAWGGCESVV